MSVAAGTHRRRPRARAKAGAGARVSVETKRTAGWSAAFLLIVVCSLVPVLWIVFLSLKTPATVTDGSFIPHHWTLSNYKDIFNAGIFTDALRNSIAIGLIATALAVVLACAAAYAIAL